MTITPITAYKVFDKVFESKAEADVYLARSEIMGAIAKDAENFPSIWAADVFADYVLRHKESLHRVLSNLHAEHPIER